MIPSWPLLGIGLRHQHAEVGTGAVRDERLRAVDHVLVAVADRGRADPGDVGAGARLGDPETADPLTLDPGDEVALLLLLAAEQVHRGQDHVGLDREAHVGPAGAGVAHALGSDQGVEVVAALAAVGLGEAEPEVAELAGAAHDLVGHSVSSHSLRWGCSSFFTQALIDSRRSRCSSVKRKCLRAPCSGLITLRSLSPRLGSFVARQVKSVE